MAGSNGTLQAEAPAADPLGHANWVSETRDDTTTTTGEVVVEDRSADREDHFNERVVAVTGAVAILALIGVVSYLAVAGREIPAYIAGLLGLLLGVPLSGPGGNGPSSIAGLFGMALKKNASRQP